MDHVVRKPTSTACRKVDLAGLKQAVCRKFTQSSSSFISPRQLIMSVLGGMERLVIVFIEVGEGLSYRVGERSTCRLIDPMLLVILSVLFATRSLFLLKIATQLSSHNCLIDSMLLDFNSGSICAFLRYLSVREC